MKLAFIFTAAVLVGSTFPAVADPDDSIEFDVRALPANLTLQDTLIIEVAVTITGDDSRFDIAEPSVPIMEQFELISTGSTSRRLVSSEAPALERITRHRLLPLRAGTVAIPAMSLEYVDIQTGEVLRLRSSEVRVTVLPGAGGLGKTAGLLILAGIVLVITFASILIYRRTQSKRRQAEPEDESREPESRLAEALEKVSVQLAYGKASAAQQILTESVQAYLGDRYRLNSGVICGENVSKELLEVGAPKILIDNWLKLHGWSASLKFSGLARSESDLTAVVSELRQIVEQTPPESRTN